jgi:hypothetical protein
MDETYYPDVNCAAVIVKLKKPLAGEACNDI